MPQGLDRGCSCGIWGRWGLCSEEAGFGRALYIVGIDGFGRGFDGGL